MMRLFIILFLLLFSILTSFAAPENVFPNGAVTLDGNNVNQLSFRNNLSVYSKSENQYFTSATNVIYVDSTRGDDGNTGTSKVLPKKSITSAIESVPASGCIVVLDKATYTESFTVPPDVTIDALNATIEGAVILCGGARLYVDKHLASADNQTILSKTGMSHSYYRANNSWYNGYENVVNIENASESSILFTEVIYMRVSGVGIRDLAPMVGIAGHIHFKVMDLYLERDNAIALDAGNDNSDLIGRIDHIRYRSPATTGLKAITVSNGAKVETVIGDIDMPNNTAYEIIGSGSLYLTCMKITGDKVGLAKEALSNFSGYTREQVDTIAAQTLQDALTGRQLLYLGTTSTTIGTANYYVLQEDTIAVSQTLQSNTITSTTLTQYNNFGGIITESLGVTSLPSGQWQITMFAENSQAGGRTVEVEARVYRTDNTNTIISQISTGTSTIAALGNGVIQRITIDLPMSSTVMNTSDKVLIVYLFRRTGVTSGTNPVIRQYTGGSNTYYTSFTLPGDILMLTDGSNSTDDVLFKGITGNYLDLNTSDTNPEYKYGRIFWDRDDDTFAIYTANTSFIHQVGQELIVRAKNVTGVTILDGQAVYISSTSVGIHPTARLAIANSTSTADVIAIATHNIEHNEFGSFTLVGIVRGLNTSGFAGGCSLYLSQTVPGSYTNTLPVSGIITEIGHTIMSHNTEGSIFVRPRVIGSLIPAYFASDITVNGKVQSNSFVASDSSIGSTSNILIDGHTLVFKDGLFIQYIPNP